MATANTSDYDKYEDWNLVADDDTSSAIRSDNYVKFAGASVSGSGTSGDPYEVSISTGGTGTVTSVSVGTGLDVSNQTTTPSITLDLSELTDMTAAVNTSQDELILLDNGAERRKLFSEVFGSAAYVASSTFATSAQGTKADNALPKAGGTMSGNLTITGSLSTEDALKTTNGRIQLGPHTSGAGIWFDRTSDDRYWFAGLSSSDGTTFRIWRSGDKLSITDAGNVTIAGTISASGYNSSNWDTAYGWGNHTSAGYSTASGVEDNANNYSLPTATASVLGGVKIGSGITITSGVISADSQTDNNFTNALKTKLDGIAASANNYSHPTPG